MKQDVMQEIEIPQDVSIELQDGVLVLKGAKGTLERKFQQPKVLLEKKDNKIVLSSKKATKRERKIIGTFAAHIRNMIHGVVEGFEYKLQICSVHFPVNVQVDAGHGLVLIKNFLGETHDRKAEILPGVDVKIEGDTITVTSADKEATGQTALNIENATKVKRRDVRIFQDGIWIIEKAGKKI